MNLLKSKAINLSFLALTHLLERKAETKKEEKKKKRGTQKAASHFDFRNKTSHFHIFNFDFSSGTFFPADASFSEEFSTLIEKLQ